MFFTENPCWVFEAPAGRCGGKSSKDAVPGRDELRKKIDEIDRELVEAFAKRMDVAAELAALKKAQGIPVVDEKREEQKLSAVAELAPEKYREYTKALYRKMFELSRDYQFKLMEEET